MPCSTPLPRATSSIVALSVSISASTSPSLTASPSCFSHLTSCPSSIVGDGASMWTFVGMRTLPVKHGVARFDDEVGRWLRGALQVLRVWHRHVRLRHAHDRRIEVIECFGLDHIDDLSTNAD